MSGGILWVPAHPLQAGAGVADSPEAARRYLDALTEGDEAPRGAERRAAFLDAGPQLISFLRDQGIPIRRCEGWSDYHDELPGGCARGRSVRTDIVDIRVLGEWAERMRGNNFALPIQWPDSQQLMLMGRTLRGKVTAARVGLRALSARIRKARLVTMGAALQARLMVSLLSTGRVDLRANAPVRGLVTGENGRVLGVQAEIDGVLRRIEARGGVLLGGGGFGHNQAMRDRNLPAPSHSDWSHTGPGDQGGLIEAAARIGAATYFDANAIWIVTSRMPDGALVFHLHDIAKPHCIMVNGQGRRFTDESGSYMANGQAMYANDAAPGWAIMDSRHRARYPWARALPGKTPREWIDTGYIRVAETLDELAAVCGLPAEVLRDTVERFNGFALAGKDLDFHRGDRAYDRVFGDPTARPNPCLGAIGKPPFYAVKVFPGDVGTAGGIVTDGKARALREDGGVIDGLYAAGNGTAPTFGRTYPGAGASIAATCVFGFVAARHVMERAGAAVQPGER